MPKPRPTPLLDLRVLLHGGAWLEVTLWREARGALRYRLCYRRGGECLVRYDSARRGGARREVHGRARPYAFRSVEQLRYDFERDVEAVAAAP